MWILFPSVLNRILMTQGECFWRTRLQLEASRTQSRGLNLKPLLNFAMVLCFLTRGLAETTAAFPISYPGTHLTSCLNPSLHSRVLKMKRNSCMESKRRDPNLKLWLSHWPRQDLRGLRFIISVKNSRLTISRNPKHTACLLACSPLVWARWKSLQRNVRRWKTSWGPLAWIQAWLTSVKWLPD